MATYASYKDSGEIWLGQIPSHWEMKRMKHIFEERSVKGYPNEPLLAATQNHGVIPKSMYENRTVEATKNLDTLKLVEPGDFVISLRSFQGGIEYAYYRGIISPAYTILCPKQEYAGYFRHLGKSKIYISLLQSMVTGIREGQNIDYSKLKNEFLPIPPLDEQKAMVTYLDEATSQIDEAIAQQQHMIDLLNERKQIIIQNAVTKGLNPNVPMKDSGIDWIGQVPETWEIKKLKHCIESSESGIWGQDEKHDGEDKVCVRVADFDYEKGCVKVDNLTLRHYGEEFTDRKRLKPRDLLLEKSGGGDLYPVGRVIRYSLDDEFTATCSNFIQKLTPYETVSHNFLYYVFRTMYFAKVNGLFYNQTTGIQNLKVKEYMSQNIYLPSLQEQEVISNYLEGISKEIEKDVDVCRNKIKLLRERKQIIISEVVTGKVKVD